MRNQFSRFDLDLFEVSAVFVGMIAAFISVAIVFGVRTFEGRHVLPDTKLAKMISTNSGDVSH